MVGIDKNGRSFLLVLLSSCCIRETWLGYTNAHAPTSTPLAACGCDFPTKHSISAYMPFIPINQMRSRTRGVPSPGQAGIEHYRLVNATAHYVQDRPSCVAVWSIHSYLDSTLVALAISEHTHHTYTPSPLFHPASSPSQVNRSHMRGSTVLFI